MPTKRKPVSRTREPDQVDPVDLVDQLYAVCLPDAIRDCVRFNPGHRPAIFYHLPRPYRLPNEREPDYLKRCGFLQPGEYARRVREDWWGGGHPVPVEPSDP